MSLPPDAPPPESHGEALASQSSTPICLAASSRSSRGPGHRPLTAATGVRIPYGTPPLHAENRPPGPQDRQRRRLVRDIRPMPAREAILGRRCPLPLFSPAQLRLPRPAPPRAPGRGSVGGGGEDPLRRTDAYLGEDVRKIASERTMGGKPRPPRRQAPSRRIAALADVLAGDGDEELLEVVAFPIEHQTDLTPPIGGTEPRRSREEAALEGHVEPGQAGRAVRLGPGDVLHAEPDPRAISRIFSTRACPASSTASKIGAHASAKGQVKKMLSSEIAARGPRSGSRPAPPRRHRSDRPRDGGTGGVHRLLGSPRDGHERLRGGGGRSLGSRRLGTANRDLLHGREGGGRRRRRQAQRDDQGWLRPRGVAQTSPQQKAASQRLTCEGVLPTIRPTFHPPRERGGFPRLETPCQAGVPSA